MNNFGRFLGRVFGCAAAACAILAAGGCATISGPQSPYALVDGWEGRVVKRGGRLAERWTDGDAVKRGAAESVGELVVLVRSVGFAIEDGICRYPAGGAASPAKTSSTGHAWLRLDTESRRIECGHSFAVGRSMDYRTGVKALLRKNDPDPARYLWESIKGRRHKKMGTRPTLAFALSITAGEEERLVEYVDAYDFSWFSFREHQCTHFVVGALDVLGISADHEVTLKIPETDEFRGRRLRFWTDPKYRELTFGSADVLEQSLRGFLEQGVGKEDR